jgi:PUA domain protein
VATELVVKKRRPINKKEARFIKEGILVSHNLDMPIEAGKYEIGKTEDFNILISKGNVIALIGEDWVHMTVRGLLANSVENGWVQVDMGAVPFVCNGANTMSAGINDVSPEIIKGQHVWIREENHHKPLAIGMALMDAKEMLTSEKGKAIKSLHYIGDKIWNYGIKD